MRPRRGAVVDDPGESTTKILLANVRGIDLGTRKRLDSKIGNGEVDIIFLVETWDNYYKNTDTATVIRKKAFGVEGTNRPQGGLEVLAHPSMHHHFTEIPTESDLILKMRFGEDIISLIYAPPEQMDNSGYEHLLEMTEGSDLILGDFNSPMQLDPVSFYEKNNMTQSKKARALLTEQWLERGNLEVVSIPFQGKTSQLDHIVCKAGHSFSSFKFTSQQQAYNIIKSDHGILEATWNRKKGKLGDSSRRYRVKNLKDPEKSKEMCKKFDEICTEQDLDDILQTMVERAHVHGLKRREIEWMVDQSEDWIQSNIQRAAESSLGSYVVKESMQTRAEYVEEILTGEEELIEAQRYLAVKSRGHPTRLVPGDGYVTAMQEMETEFNKVYKEKKPFNWPTPPLHEPLNGSPISQKRIKQVIRNYPSGKAPGPDGVMHGIYKCLIEDSKLQLHLKQLYKLIFLTGYTPRRWNLSKIFPLPKGAVQGQTHPAADTRPIALTAMMRRYFEKYLLIDWKGLGLCVHDANQAGFREGFSTISHAILAHTTPSDLKVYLDVSKAYDKLSHRYLKQIMEERKVPKLHRAIVQSLMSNCSSVIMVNGQISRKLSRDLGVFQGSIISPTIFNWIMDKLAKDLHTVCGNTLEPSFLMYADDVLLCTRGYDPVKTQSMLDVCSNWAEAAGLTFGLKKCATQGIKEGDNLYLGQDRLDEAESYKYLGFDMKKEGIDWKRTWARAIHGTKAYMRFLFATRTAILPERHKSSLVKTYVESRLRYPLGLWAAIPDKEKQETESIMDCIDEIYNDCLSYIYGFAMKTTKVIQADMVGLMEPKVLVDVAESQVLKHIKQLSHENPLKQVLEKTVSKNSLLIKIGKWLRSKNQKTQVMITAKAKEDRFKRSGLIRYMQESPRTKNGRDWTLEISDHPTRRMALQIRTGYMFREKDPLAIKCFHCFEVVKRTHWNNCPALNTAIPSEILQDFHNTKSRLFNGEKDKFTVFDHLLNKQKPQLAKMLVDKIVAGPDRP